MLDTALVAVIIIIIWLGDLNQDLIAEPTTPFPVQLENAKFTLACQFWEGGRSTNHSLSPGSVPISLTVRVAVAA